MTPSLPLDLHKHAWLSEENDEHLKKLKDEKLNKLLDLKELQIEVEPCKLDLHKFFTSNLSSFLKPLDLALELPKFKLELPKLDLLPIIVLKNHDTILIARPLKEFFSHIWNLKIPSLELVARVIKTLALSI